MEKKISLIGAGQIGGTLAHLITIKELGNVVLFDIDEGLAKGKALDIAQSTSVSGSTTNLIGTSNYEDTKNSEVIIITAGIPRKPGMSRDDLLGTNLKIIKQVAEGIRKTSPNAFVICITNPLDVIVMAFQKYSDLPKNKVVGMAGILDSSRFKYFLSQELKVPVKSVQSLVLGGHGDTMVPMPKQTKVNNKPLNELIQKASEVGGEIVLDVIIAENAIDAELEILKGDYNKAIDLLNANKNKDWDKMQTLLSKSYRLKGDLDESKEIIEKMCDDGDYCSKDAQYEAALVYYDLGQHDKAREYLNGFLDHYKHADATYKPVVDARETLRKWDAAEN